MKNYFRWLATGMFNLNYGYFRIKAHQLKHHPLIQASLNLRVAMFVLAIFLSAQAFAQVSQKASISGTVLDRQGHPLAGVTVSLRKKSDSTLINAAATDGSGKFKLEDLNAGQYSLLSTFIGYERNIGGTIDLADGESKVLPAIVLSESAKKLGGVSVTAKKPFIERQVDKTVLNIESDVIASGGTALEALKRAPGVTVDKDDNIQLRGKAGVTIMLDGKITYLSPAQVSTLLKNMPASSVQTIEVITQPSAKYDAAGNTGIINIKTKKLKKSGLNGVATIGTSIAAHTRYNSSLNLNYQTGKFNFYTNYDYNRYSGLNHLDLTRKIDTKTGQTYLDDKGHFLDDYHNNTYKAGVDFTASKNHVIGVQLSGYQNSGVTDGYNQTKFSQVGATKIDSVLTATTYNPGKFNSIDYNLNYKGTLDTSGTELSADLDYSKFRNDNHSILKNVFSLPEGSVSTGPPLPGPFTIRNYLPSDIDIKVGKVDFTHPFSKKFKMETGLKYSAVKTNNNVIYDSLRNGVFVPALSQSNQFIYTEKVAAAYASFNTQIQKLGVQFGLRVENTQSEGNSITENKDVKRNYTDFFPNLALTQKVNENNQFGLSYTRRIDRPGYQDLNPFRFYLDQFTYQEGNPFLKPQYTNAFEFSYTFKQSTFVSLNYSHTRDVSTQVLLQDSTTKVTKQSTDNLASLDSYGLTFSRPFILTKWWTLSANLQTNYNKYKADSSARGGVLDAGKLNFNVNITNSITLPHDFTLEIQGFYNSPAVYAYLHANEMYSINAGIQKSFLNKKANLKLNVSDIFNTQKFTGYQKGNGIDLTVVNKNESRRFGLTFTYHFGGNPYQGSRKQTGSEDEKSRVKTH